MSGSLQGAIGLFGGTFNPVHFGHLNLAIEMKEKFQLKEVWWIPAKISPIRTQEPPIDGSHRFHMVSLAIEGIPDFRVLDLELRREGVSYTIDTIREFLKTKEKFTLILGEDALLQFKEWKEYEEISRLVPLLIGCRRKADLRRQLHSFGMAAPVEDRILKGLVETGLIEISSTEIRKRLKQNLYCGHLVPSKVLDYIYENQLYYLSQS